jgi:hypothetical protein
MVAFSLGDLLGVRSWLGHPFAWLVMAFCLWMLVDAIRRAEWWWVLFIVLFPFVNAILYYLLVYRTAAPNTRGLTLLGSHDRKRIRELQAQIHHLDKAHHHLELADIYLRQGKLDLAEGSYRAALARDPADTDTRAHLGQCLLRLRRPAEARPLLDSVCAADPKHDYGNTLMTLAETCAMLGDKGAAIALWKRVLENHSYARAHVQLAELYLEQRQPDLARAELTEVLTDAAHAPKFDRRRDRLWINRAKRLLNRV